LGPWCWATCRKALRDRLQMRRSWLSTELCDSHLLQQPFHTGKAAKHTQVQREDDDQERSRRLLRGVERVENM